MPGDKENPVGTLYSPTMVPMSIFKAKLTDGSAAHQPAVLPHGSANLSVPA
jgi:hypothetical protein